MDTDKDAEEIILKKLTEINKTLKNIGKTVSKMNAECIMISYIMLADKKLKTDNSLKK